MSNVSLSGVKEIIADSVSLIEGNEIINIKDKFYDRSTVNTMLSSVIGLPPETLNSLEKVSNALDDDPNFFTTINGKFDNKQNKLILGTPITGSQNLLNTTTSKLKNIVASNLTLTTDDNNLTITGINAYTKTETDVELNKKQVTLVVGASAVSGLQQPILSTNIIKNILAGTGITLSSGTNNITITGIDAYSKSAVDTKFSDLINSAPSTMDTLNEIAAIIGNSSSISSTLITLISQKANSSETFLKSIVNNDVYLPLLNKRFISTGTINNKLLLQIQDNVGNIINDAWYDGLSLELDINTKKIKCTISDSLIVDNINILTELSNKINSSALASYALKESPTFTGTATANNLTVTNNLVIGTTNVLTSLNKKVEYITDPLLLNVIEVDTLRPKSIGAYNTPHIKFDTSIAVVGNVNISGSAILMVDGLNIVNAINEKLPSSSLLLSNTAVAWSSGYSANSYHQLYTGTEALQIRTPTALELAMTIQGSGGGFINEGKTTFYKQVTIPQLELQGDLNISKSAPSGLNVVSSITNTGLDGYSSLYLKTTGQITNETGQLFVGQQLGLVMMTRTAHALRFKTYSDELNATPPFSMQILGTGTRDVEILAPLTVTNNTIITGNLVVNGNLTLSGFNVIKPYISMKITTSGGTPSTLTTIGTPGASVAINCGYTSAVTLARGTSGATNAFLYTISWTSPHPLGSNYMVMCNFQGGSTTNLSPNGFFRANGTSTNITIWVRTSDGIIKDENFYVYSVP